MPYIINESGDDFQQGGCLYKLTSSIQWTPKNSWMPDRPQRQALSSKKQTYQLLAVATSGVVVISWFIDAAINWQ